MRALTQAFRTTEITGGAPAAAQARVWARKKCGAHSNTSIHVHMQVFKIGRDAGLKAIREKEERDGRQTGGPPDGPRTPSVVSVTVHIALSLNLSLSHRPAPRVLFPQPKLVRCE